MHEFIHLRHPRFLAGERFGRSEKILMIPKIVDADRKLSRFLV